MVALASHSYITYLLSGFHVGQNNIYSLVSQKYLLAMKDSGEKATYYDGNSQEIVGVNVQTCIVSV